MVHGFYTLASGMLTQDRVLETAGNNLANSETNGFKADRIASKTFGSMVVQRLDGQATPIGTVTMMAAADREEPDFSQGTLRKTGRALDFALAGDGFFAVQTAGGVLYTRRGGFKLDAQGYLSLPGAGRVLGRDGAPIFLGTDDVTCDRRGNLLAAGRPAGSLGVFRFGGNAQVQDAGEGFYRGAGAQPAAAPDVRGGYLEDSNTDDAKELTDAIAAQRSLQSCAQALKLYDAALDKTTTQLGKV
ncbi:MAG TPA: flagellar biosynthesis protein FlgF [Ruminococcaceae bacterium]|jgi:flagellar basal-body rod protein FlgG|nr:flagellar biosynthesis protein FlgF [Oscillospiraceae bacterium]HBG54926.1 flagellar biosynthesis protein FlgF [Oscillospiraceae bacterium]HBT91368.1 flagellar biosynthesis protein FlgF [Oscillospiraceae bacterium]